jgi:hypothetical protein
MFFAVLPLILLVAAGLWLWLLVWRFWRLRAEMRRWPTAKAMVHGVSVREPRHSSIVEVEVSYRHEGCNYRVWCKPPAGGSHGGPVKQAERQVAMQFPVRSVHPVYLNPERLDEAFLELPKRTALALGAGGGLLLIGVAAGIALSAFSMLDAELAGLLVMALLGVLLSGFVILVCVAWAKAPRRRWRGRR